MILERALNGLVLFCAVLGGLALLLMMVQICVDVIARSIFFVSLPGTNVSVAYYWMIAVGFLPLGLAEKQQAHITVDLVYNVMTAPSQRIVDFLAHLFSAALMVYLSVLTWHKAVREYNIGRMIVERDVPVPTWPGFWFIWIGVTAFAMFLIFRVVSTLSVAIEAHRKKRQ